LPAVSRQEMAGSSSSSSSRMLQLGMICFAAAALPQLLLLLGYAYSSCNAAESAIMLLLRIISVTIVAVHESVRRPFRRYCRDGCCSCCCCWCTLATATTRFHIIRAIHPTIIACRIMILPMARTTAVRPTIGLVVTKPAAIISATAVVTVAVPA
jgi:hypothetical protein